ncbi:putative phage-type endonuclease [Paenibacillus cellulosilyticus]|uniref:Putative phage-type endonuclease n=1 Tax=Paenibacillus cellulosilyticus TaxID=375489 RepID=A0A2V2Z336_9BACL|nr:YqaJ viral recombinase family protein [Paenibacillus cellulosilyticus]PWW03244.1 putative phage-type endonuclease [Paenibacillus cellulosilyticus]QKS43730.1 YqaJ viral recombinase family protein [Paenibacillus cellulosilyticus]
MTATILTHTRLITTEERERWRRTGIGGSDIAAIMGVNPWRTSREVYLDKKAESPGAGTTESMALGMEMKSVIAAQFSERTGYRTFRRNMLFAHSQHRHLIATIDRWVVGDGAGLLCKSVGEYRKAEWEDGKIPEVVALQCQHYMAVMGTDHWWVAGMIGGNKLSIVRVERDEQRIATIIRVGSRFWEQHVLANRPPEVDGSDASTRLLSRQYPPEEVNVACITLPEEANDWIAQYRLAEAEEKHAQRRKTEAENQLKQMLGTNERGQVKSELVEWKRVNVRSNGRSDFRRFRIVSKKS